MLRVDAWGTDVSTDLISGECDHRRGVVSHDNLRAQVWVTYGASDPVQMFLFSPSWEESRATTMHPEAG